MTKNTKYGLFYYNTENIGDEIQSIAANRFLPHVDYYIDRDHIDKTVFKTNDKVKLIMNGWYLHPDINDQKIHWPPTNPNLIPLLTSIHVSNIHEIKRIFSSPASSSFLKTYAPVGARDQATMEFFKSLDIPTYFSGCISLTLLPSPKVKKSDYILAVDVSPKVLSVIKQRTKRPIITLSAYRSFNLTTDEKFILAKYFLTLYQGAHCTITPRLHVILPSLAFGTPVIALDLHHDPDRYSGLLDLTNHYTENEFINNSAISIDQPLKNPTIFHPLRDNLIKICTDFTGYDSKSSYLEDQTIEDIINNPLFINLITKSLKLNYDYEEKNKISSSTIKNLQIELKNEQKLSKKQQESITKADAIIAGLKSPGVRNASKTLLKTIKKSLKNHL